MPALRTLGEAQSYRSGTHGTRAARRLPTAGSWPDMNAGLGWPRRADIVAIGARLLRSPARGRSLDGGQGPDSARRPGDNGEPRSSYRTTPVEGMAGHPAGILLRGFAQSVLSGGPAQITIGGRHWQAGTLL
jgi:hypothetical protein